MEKKFDWMNLTISLLAVVAGFALAAWGIFALNKVLHPGDYLACPYGFEPTDTSKPECTVIAAPVTATETTTATATAPATSQ